MQATQRPKRNYGSGVCPF